MILEVALIRVRPGEGDAMEASFAEARLIVAAAPGCRDLRLHRGIESPERFVLLVEWDSVAAHMEGFRRSPDFERWRALMHRHFAGPADVEHYTIPG